MIPFNTIVLRHAPRAEVSLSRRGVFAEGRRKIKRKSLQPTHSKEDFALSQVGVQEPSTRRRKSRRILHGCLDDCRDRRREIDGRLFVSLFTKETNEAIEDNAELFRSHRINARRPKRQATGDRQST